MHLPSSLSILALATTVYTASTQVIKNYCTVDKYITLYLNETGLDGPFAITSGKPQTSTPRQAYLAPILGTGNQINVANTNAPFGAPVPRFTLGTSTDNGILYWAISHLSGDPMTGIEFNVTSSNPVTPDVCNHVTSYDGQVHACSDNDVMLTLNICSDNE